MDRPGFRVRMVWLWGLVPAIALAEMVMQWRIPRQEPSSDEWKAAARAIGAEKGVNDLVVTAPAWATQGRMSLGALVPVADFGRFDTTRYDRVFEVSLNGARAPETEGLPVESEESFGRIAVRRYRLSPRATVLYDFMQHLGEAHRENGGYTNPVLMIDHWFNPRFVMPVPLKRRTVALTFENVPTGGVLRGYGLIGYRSGRFNKGGPVSLRVFVDGAHVGGASFRNFGPLEPFELALPGRQPATVRFEVSAVDNLSREFGLAADVRRKPGAAP
ncbi:MAG: hypothetical protein PHU25_10520 [Deltaproteobacteria bacterium]|nr:hypothetical protein [Deltaproteobacteria bacterium]